MRKQLSIIICTAMLWLLMIIPALAVPTVFLDGQQLSFDVPPTIEDGRTLVPLRAIFEALGADITWDDATQTVTANKKTLQKNISIKLTIGQTTAYKNGFPVQLDVPAKIINQRTMVPVRFVSETLDAMVGWNPSTQKISIGYVPPTGTIPIPPQTKVHYIDVGQADSIYIELPNSNDILIDGGNRADGPLVVNYLKDQSVDDIELLIATHPHEDHIGGLPAVFDAFEVEQTIDSGYLTDSKISGTFKAKATEEGNYTADNYQQFTYDDVTLNILTGAQTWNDCNDYSVVCRLDTGDIEFLFTGDAETPVENILTGELEAEILKVGHHGSTSSSSEEFLNKVKPEVAIICCGTGNRYEHPHQETLTKLQNLGAEIYRTDLSGNIVVSTDGNTYSVTAQKNVQATPIAQPAGTAPKLIPDSLNGSDWVAITNINLQGEMVTIKNNSNWPVDMTGWYLISETGNQTYYFPSGYTLAAGATIYVTSGRGDQDDGSTYLKWGSAYIWNNDGDPGELYNASGQLVSEWP